MKLTSIAIALSTAFVATGCAQFTVTNEKAKEVVRDKAQDAIQKVEVDRPAAKVPFVREIDAPYVSFKRVEAQKIAGEVSLSASNAPFGALVNELGSKAGYSVVFSENVDVNRKVSATFEKAVSDMAIKELAFQAGYVAVIDTSKNTVFISDMATYTFKLPASIMQPMGTTYSISGSPSSSSGGGGGGGGGGGSGVTATFAVNGNDKIGPDKMIAQITELAGRGSSVNWAENGIITVKGSASGLRRVHNFLRDYTRESMRQIDIEATIVEVTLANDFKLGIQWDKMLNSADVSKSFSSIGAAASGNLSAIRTSASSSTVLDALAKATDIQVVSQPRIVTQNGIAATVYSGLSRPYLGTIQSNVSNSGGAVTTSTGGTLEYAVDGVSLSVIPSVLDDKNVSLTLMPVLSTIEALEEFSLGDTGETLIGPRKSDRHAFNKVIVENGKTLILGGLRFTSENKSTLALTETGTARQNKELVFIIRSNIQKASTYDPLINEAI